MNKEKDQLVKLLTSSKVPHAIPADAIVIIDGVRTPVTKAKRGGLKDYKADELLSVVLKVQDTIFELKYIMYRSESYQYSRPRCSIKLCYH